jgi:hypothetical protein
MRQLLFRNINGDAFRALFRQKDRILPRAAAKFEAVEAPGGVTRPCMFPNISFRAGREKGFREWVL